MGDLRQAETSSEHSSASGRLPEKLDGGTRQCWTCRVQMTADCAASWRPEGRRVDLGTHLHGEGAPGLEAAPLLAAQRLAHLATQDDPLPRLLPARIRNGDG